MATEKWGCRICGEPAEIKHLMQIYYVRICPTHINAIDGYFRDRPLWEGRLKIDASIRYWQAQSALPDPHHEALEALKSLITEVFRLDAQLVEIAESWLTREAAAWADAHQGT